ncbi:MAG: DUF898 domain-containing protein [Deltaproteobacteria bacterium]|nr:DUF898 domain-containing protein [Deltaproteobacteria bacterium]
MPEIRYNVVYRGRLLPSFEISAVKSKLMATFPINEKQAEAILKGSRVVLKKNADETTAKRLGMALKRAGMDIVLTESTAAPGGDSLQDAYIDPRKEKATKLNSGQAKEKDDSVAGKQGTPPDKPESVWEPSAIPFEFTGSGREYFKIWVVNIILSILTLGIYSAWAKVRRKQYIYGNTRLQGAAFEYLADPVKILKGRLIVIGFFVLSSAASIFIPVAEILFTLIFIAAIPWVMVRTLMFNARNSAIRNIRFGFKGRVKEAILVFMLWPILAVFTLGAIFPYVYWRQKKFIVENSTYGRTRFVFTASAREYYRLFYGALIPIVVGVLLLVGAGFLFAPLIFLVIVGLYLYLFSFYSVKTTNLLYNTSSLSHNRFKSELKIMEYLMLVFTNSLGTALTLGLFSPWARIRTLRYRLGHLTLFADADPESFVASEEKQVSALGEEFGDFFDMDIGL